MLQFLAVPESFNAIEELAVFPLSTVLFPGAILPLHIFEDRYKQLMKFALDNDGLFGLSYRRDAAISRETLPEIGSVGCVAKINVVIPLEEGRMNIISTGLIRYKIIAFQQSIPFPVARIESVSDDLEPGADLNRTFDDIADVCRRFLEAAQALDEANAPAQQDLPEDPEAFSLLVSSALPIENEAKQNLLEMTSTKLRLTRLRQYVTTALAEYSDRLRIQRRAKGNGHGRVHIDE
ncbi:MAG: LON peptidase substrate-binding domain-containing protein [Blastocatellia bacterium]